MLLLQGTGRTKELAGINKHTNRVEKIEDLLCARKHVISKKGWKTVSNASRLFSFISSPTIYKQPELVSLVKGWCHGFRKPDKRLPRKSPKIMMPESDFMDPMFVKCDNSGVSKKYDYFYFTINAQPGIDHKGLTVFIESLPVLDKCGLRGLVIVYYPNSGMTKRFAVRLSRTHTKMLSKFDKLVTYKWGLLNGDQINRAMQSCRFGFFPNTVDNSPRLISECLIRDIPILVNKKIHGGWHYATDDTGTLFGSSMESAIDFMMTHKFCARDYFTANYGFERSSKRLSLFLNKIFGIDDYSHVYFDDFKKYLKAIR